MTLLVERVNEAAAKSALADPEVSSRLAVRIDLSDGPRRFVIDSLSQTVDGEDYAALPFVAVSEYGSQAGQLADVVTLAMDGGPLLEAGLDGGMVSSIIETLTTVEMRDRPVQISRLVLNVNTAAPIGLFPVFFGFVDSGEYKGDTAPVFEMRVSSFRAYARRQPVRRISDEDHQQRWPDDRLFKYLASTVATGRVIPWNTTNGGSSANANLSTSRIRQDFSSVSIQF